jgi:hypothetical protein
MEVIEVRNVNSAYAELHAMVEEYDGDYSDSRNGPVIEFGPVTTLYTKPQERVLWDAARDANPFFHLFESLWMLAGRNDIAFVSRYAKRMATYSDDGVSQWGAYGYRWRHYFGFDQIPAVINELRKDPTSRRAVLAMWDARGDVGKDSKDLPCNLNAKFEIRRGRLDMMVFNRSNDAVWGAYGANAVHFSILQEYMAARLGVRIGSYWQISANFHVYVKVWEEVQERAKKYADHDGNVPFEDLYEDGRCEPMLLVMSPEGIDNEISEWMRGSRRTGNIFLDNIARPLDDIWELWLAKDRAKAHVRILALPQDNDWVYACRRWMERRIEK